jgi:aryl-alcohol dehydrogenase-like predicted oxidoreductase
VLKKLILGTAGLGGLPYGKEKRIVSEAEALDILTCANRAGIDTADTSPMYGQAEARIGRTGPWKRVYTKTTGDVDEAISSLELIRSRVCWLWHNWHGAPLLAWTSGVTVYCADKLAVPNVRVVQSDWNLLNQELPWTEKPPMAIVRSVFLQGCLTGNGHPRVEDLRRPIARAARMAAIFGIDLETLALRAALEHPCIDGVVIGPTSVGELGRCLEIANRPDLGLGDLRILHSDSPATDPRTWEAA